MKIECFTLYINVVNNSLDSITILKPATSINDKWRNYYCDLIACDDIVLRSMDSNVEMLNFNVEDLFTINPNLSNEIILMEDLIEIFLVVYQNFL